MQEEQALSSPRAFALGFLSFAQLTAKAPCLSLYPVFVTLAMVGISPPPPLCIPLSIHQTIPQSMTLSQRQQCGVGARLTALSEECKWAAFILAEIFRRLPLHSHCHRPQWNDNMSNSSEKISVPPSAQSIFSNKGGPLLVSRLWKFSGSTLRLNLELVGSCWWLLMTSHLMCSRAG